MLITARDPDAPRLSDGVLAHARSPDPPTWDLQPPLTEPAGFGQIEVPQVRVVDGRYVLVFTCHPQEQSAGQIERFGPHSPRSVLGAHPRGPWANDAARPFDTANKPFATPPAQRRDS